LCAFDPKVTKEWLPVDLYFGGAEHSVLHLMYARFVTQVLYDLKMVSFEEPFPHFYAHGLMIKDGAKMSKSRGNVVNPDTYVDKFGADTMRLYLMFMGPMDGSPDFRDTGIEGMERFLKRVLTLFEGENNGQTSSKVLSKLHRTIQKVTQEIESFRYNTAIAAIMELVNTLKDSDSSEIGADVLKTLTQLLAPFAPHISEELWREQFHQKESIHMSTWPSFDSSLIIETEVVIPVQVNGKLRGQLTVSLETSHDEAQLVELAKDNDQVSHWIEGGYKKVVFISGKLLNFVL
jgi:leucyl-tRNA synthetase